MSPSKTPKQAKFMAAVAGGMKPKGGGPTPGVAKEFVVEDKKTGRFGVTPKKPGIGPSKRK